MGTSDLVGPSFNALGLDFDRGSALAADQVVVMRRRAGSKQGLAARGLQAVGLAGLGKIGERTINRGQADGRTVVAQGQVQLLRADEAGCLA